MRSSRALVALSFLMASGGTASSQAPRHEPVCPDRTPDVANCTARVVVDDRGRALRVTPQRGSTNARAPYGPLQFLRGYGLTGQAPSGTPPIIAIVDAYDNPYIASELAAYSSFYNIPPLPDCTKAIASSASPCFLKVNQRGQASNYPPPDQGWGLEISLDVEIAHAICQNCSILLVEANSNSYRNLVTAEGTAVELGAAVVSNSWSSGEFKSETSLDKYFAYPGVAVLFASGDGGYKAGTQYPAASPYVTAVGGTTLYLNLDSSYNSESAWSGAGSGCSAYEAKPDWQPLTSCGSNRTVADVAADADPATGAAVYNTTFTGTPTWFWVGGTSLATPIVAGVYALSGPLPANIWESSLPYIRPPANLHDVTSGTNGSCGTYLCNAVPGYDGPTGLGTPNGPGGF